MEAPLVSVICLSYNHERFIEEAVQSVLNQTYPNVELILVDDASKDSSQEKIKGIVAANPAIKMVLLEKNVSNCKAFNKGLTQANGEFAIDFAADDVLLPSRIDEGLKALQKAGSEYGVHFCDAEWIDETGAHLYFHSDKFPHKTIPQGDIYKEIISRYFICPASTLVKREVLTHLDGYDESLAYEDFDFLVRASRSFKFAYSQNVLVKKRVTVNAMSKRQFRLFSRDAETTFVVCEKILLLNRSKDEQRALRKRITYEMKLNVRLLNLWLVLRYFLLWIKSESKTYE
jgi:glycosyltransferase involved in cell wall biosynthesis